MATAGPQAQETRTQEAQRRFGAFLRDRVNPGAVDRDRLSQGFAPGLYREAAALGLLAPLLPPSHGGESLPFAAWGAWLEECGRLCGDFSFLMVLGFVPLLARSLLELKRPDVDARWVQPFVRGEQGLAWAYTDTADAFHFRSTARRDGDSYVLDGCKPMVTGAQGAAGFVTYLRTDADDLQVFMIERDDPGVTVEPMEVSGLRATGLARLTLKGVRVSADRLLVAHDGISHAQRFLNTRRVGLTAALVGRLDGLLDAAIQQLAQVERYGQPLTEMQNVQASLGRLSVKVQLAQLASRAAFARVEQGLADPMWDEDGSAAKYFVVEQAGEVASGLLRLLGGAGYQTALGFERALRDFAGLIAGAGAQDVLEVDLGTLAIRRAMLRNKDGGRVR